MYVKSRLPVDIEKRLALLSPTKREETKRGLVVVDEGLLEFLRHNLDEPEINELLLDPELRAEVLGEQAGIGYRQVVSPRTKTGGVGKPQLVPDKALEMSDIEREMVDINSLIRQINYDSTGKTIEIDSNDPVYKLLQDFVNTKGQKGITDTAKGGIAGIKHTVYGSRDKHPLLPALDAQTAKEAVARQLYDNLLGNKLGVQPSGMMNKKGDISGIPVEHDKDFENYPELGYDPKNRNLGSTFNNSIARSEGNVDKRRALFLNHLNEKINNIEKATGKTFLELTQEMNYFPQRKLVERMAYDPSVRGIVDPAVLGVKDAQSPELVAEYTGSSREDSPGENTDRALNIRAGGNVTIGQDVLRAGNSSSRQKNKKFD